MKLKTRPIWNLEILVQHTQAQTILAQKIKISSKKDPRMTELNEIKFKSLINKY